MRQSAAGRIFETPMKKLILAAFIACVSYAQVPQSPLSPIYEEGTFDATVRNAINSNFLMLQTVPTANAKSIYGIAVCSTVPTDTQVLTYSATFGCWTPSASTGSITGTGSSGFLSLWNGTTSLTSSHASDNGTTFVISLPLSVNSTGTTSTLKIGNGTVIGCLELVDSSGNSATNYVTASGGTLTTTTSKPSGCS